MDSFEAAASAVVEEASEQTGGVWLVTRGEGSGQMVLCSSGEHPTVRPGEVLERIDGAQVVVELGLPDGSVYGCLAGWADQDPVHASMAARTSERMATILEAILAADWAAARAVDRQRAATDGDPFIDAESGVLSHAGWDRAVLAEEHRHRRYGVEEAAVLCVRLDDQAPDPSLVRRTAWVLHTTSRESDVVARVGPADFCVLALRCSPEMRNATTRRYTHALQSEAVAASVAIASVPPAATLTDAWRRASAALVGAEA